MQDAVLDLKDLLMQVREELEDCFPELLWVRAEISSLQVKGGHCYLELSQTEEGRILAKTRAVIWRNIYGQLDAFFFSETGSHLEAGMKVLVCVKVRYNEIYGFSLDVSDIDPAFTLGEAEANKKKTIEALARLGLLNRQKELELAVLPYRLAVISGSGAAGYGDFIRHLNENIYGFVFASDLIEATVQGEKAPESIMEALSLAEASHYDAVLIIRGGGSVLDLACFDDYCLCEAIANCGVPVFTAIGHDRDYHVADMVAYHYVKTPTALADWFIEAYLAEDEKISSFALRLKLALNGRISEMENRLDRLEDRIRNADPRNILSRGYTLAADMAGVIVHGACSFKTGEGIRVMFKDGELICRVEEIKLNEDGR